MFLLLALCVAVGCARNLRQPVPGPAPDIGQLWRDGRDTESRDMVHGPGGIGLVPPPATYSFVAVKSAGTNPGYDVRDPQGRLWSVKLGDEAQSEVTTGRILWALGFHQPPTYYVNAWRMSGHGDGDQPAGRFRLEMPEHEVVGDWSWYDNEFIGTRPYAALIAVNLLLNNWDLKTSNNKVYAVTEGGRVEHRYVVRDLGASLGKARQPRLLSWLPFMRHKQGTKNTLEDFEKQGWVSAVENGMIDFDYRGLDKALAGSVAVDDMRWTIQLLSQLSERHWHDAFRAGGYDAEQSARYVKRIQEKIAHARQMISAG
ncbi:MAG: hypothetical protein ACRD3G_07055 [Vicinamibacterales bacterium]